MTNLNPLSKSPNLSIPMPDYLSPPDPIAPPIQSLAESSDFSKYLSSKAWRLNNLYYFTDKNSNLRIFKPNQAQKHFLKNKSYRNLILKSRQLGFCLHPDTRVLTADLQWIPIKDLVPGQEIISVDEHIIHSRGCGRKMRTGKVIAVVGVKRDAYKISFDDGRSVICTGKHPWLCKKSNADLHWGTIDFQRSVNGEDRKTHIQVGTMVRSITKPWGETTIEDGWFAGMLDGEGFMDKVSAKKSPTINVSQLSGPVWERLVKYAQDEGYSYRIENDKTLRKTKYGRSPVPKLCFGRMDELFKLLGKCRPTRFGKRKFWEGRELPGKKTGIGWSVVTKIEKLPEQIMIDLQTTEGTYIAEGFVSHNTTLATIDMLDNVLFYKNFHALLISYDEDSAKDLFQKKVQFAWEHLDPDLKKLYTLDSSRSNLLRLDHGSSNFSDFKVDNTGRSGTFNHLHISEFASICANSPEKVDKIIRGTFPCVHPPHGQITIESTSEGPTGDFYEMFQEAYALPKNHIFRPNEFKAFFYNWQWDTEAISNVTQVDEEIPKEFKEIQKRHNEQATLHPDLFIPITDLQLTYYFYLWNGNCRRSWRKLFLEYPLTPEDAFKSTSRNIFDLDVLSELKNKAKAKIPQEFKSWLFFDTIKPNHQYVIGADPSEGIGGDHSAASIIDFSYKIPRIIATFMDNTISPDLFAYELRTMGEKLNFALIIVERNNHGHATLQTLKGIYPMDYIYKEKITNKEEDQDTTKLGWSTNLATKPRMFYEFSTALNDGLLDIPSLQILKEASDFDRKHLSKLKTDDGESTKHFDLLTSAAIAYQGRSELQDVHTTTQIIAPKTNNDPFSVI